MASTGTVYIVDDDDSVREALVAVMEAEGLDVHGWGDPRAFVECELAGPPACIVLDLQMPEMTGLDVQSRLLEKCGLPIIFLSGNATVATSVAAMKGGAVEFLEKPVDTDDLVEAVRAALDASLASFAHHEEVEEARNLYGGLTDRQREVLILASKGLTNAQIGEMLSITERTVKFHRHLAMQRMGIETIAEFARIAERAGLC